MTTIAIFGAAGKIGARITNGLRGQADADVLYVEDGFARRPG